MLATFPLSCRQLSDESIEKIDNASKICTKYFQSPSANTITKGSHPTPLPTVKQIIKTLSPSKIIGKSVLEIGVGYPRLACIFSAISGKPVLCNDIRKFYRAYVSLLYLFQR